MPKIRNEERGERERERENAFNFLRYFCFQRKCENNNVFHICVEMICALRLHNASPNHEGVGGPK